MTREGVGVGMPGEVMGWGAVAGERTLPPKGWVPLREDEAGC